MGRRARQPGKNRKQLLTIFQISPMPLPASLHVLDFGEQFQYARHVFARQKQQEQVEQEETGRSSMSSCCLRPSSSPSPSPSDGPGRKVPATSIYSGPWSWVMMTMMQQQQQRIEVSGVRGMQYARGWRLCKYEQHMPEMLSTRNKATHSNGSSENHVLAAGQAQITWCTSQG